MNFGFKIVWAEDLDPLEFGREIEEHIYTSPHSSIINRIHELKKKIVTEKYKRWPFGYAELILINGEYIENTGL